MAKSRAKFITFEGTEGAGKSTLIAIKALHAALTLPNTAILVLSTSERQAGALVEIAANFTAQLQLPRKRLPGYEYSLQLPNGSRIFAVPAASATRGPAASIVIVDDAALVPDHRIAAVTPSLTRTTGSLWLLSTPNGQSGLFYNVWHNKNLPLWLRCKATVDDMPRATPAFLSEQRALFPLSFRQDFYCEFLPPHGALLSREEVERMFQFGDSIPLHPQNPPG